MSTVEQPNRLKMSTSCALEMMAPFALIAAVLFSLAMMLITSEIRNNRMFKTAIDDRAIIKAQNQRSIDDRLAMHLELRRLEARLPAAKP